MIYEVIDAMSVHVAIPPDETLCFVASPDVITYPGDLTVLVAPVGGSQMRVQPVWATGAPIEPRTQTAYSQLRDWNVVTSWPESR